MTEKRYTITLGKNNEFKEIIDHSKQDKHISVIEFLKQVGEQDKAFKELKKENKELKKEVDEQDRRKWACLKTAHLLDLENEELKQKLRLYKKLYPAGKWITELSTKELEKELSE